MTVSAEIELQSFVLLGWAKDGLPFRQNRLLNLSPRAAFFDSLTARRGWKA